MHNAQRKALGALGLEPDATRTEIKASFKALVKRHHPDANGGDRSSEGRDSRGPNRGSLRRHQFPRRLPIRGRLHSREAILRTTETEMTPLAPTLSRRERGV